MEKVGLFVVSYEITTGLAGAPTFHVNLAVNTPARIVSGGGTVTNTSNPPLNLHTSLRGDYTYMTVMPNNSKILVVLNGIGEYSPINPLEVENTKLRMVLEDDWSKGTANFSYRDDRGQWNEIKDAKVTKVTVAEPVSQN